MGVTINDKIVIKKRMLILAEGFFFFIQEEGVVSVFIKGFVEKQQGENESYD